MFRLIGVELRRFGKRTAFRWAGIALIAVVGLTLFSAYHSANPTNSSSVAQAQAMADEANEQNSAYFAEGGECEKEEAAAGPGVDMDCDYVPELATAADYMPESKTYSDQSVGNTSALASLFAFVALVIGISFVTAEFSSGAITNWLTFQPRRGWVYASKAIAVSTGVGLAAAAILALFYGGQRLAYGAQNALGDQFNHAAQQNLEMSGRILVLAVIAALMGMALGVLLRHAALAIGLLFGYLIAETMLLALVSSTWRWALTPRIAAWIDGSYEISGQDGCATLGADGSCVVVSHYIFQASAGWYLLGTTVAMTAFAWAVFRRRDVI